MGETADLLDTSSVLRERALACIPGGVHSNIRLDGPKAFIDRAKGAWLWGVDGDKWVDYLLGQGPNFLGHAPDPVLAAVESACQRGMVYGGQHVLEVEASELVCAMVGWADRVRFGVSGTESVQAAFRAARAATGKRKVIRFEGHYHGWLDNVLLAYRDGGWGPGSAGQLGGHLDDFVLLPWNDAEAVAETLTREGEDIAAVIMEPMMINAGVIEPLPGYLESVRRLCDAHGVVLIFDEVISGFRLGLTGAVGRFGVVPDLATYGKAMAGGWPVSALVGRAELMDPFGNGRVNHAGTFNASVMAMAATVATLTTLRDDPPYAGVDEHGTALMAGIEQLGDEYDVPLHVQGVPAAFHVSFGTEDAVDHGSLRRLDLARYAKFANVLVEHGVWVAARGVWYVSASHGPTELDAAMTGFDQALSDWLGSGEDR